MNADTGYSILDAGCAAFIKHLASSIENHLRHPRTNVESESSPRAHRAGFEGGEVFALAGQLLVRDGGDQAAVVHGDVLAAAVLVPLVAEAEAVDEGDHGGVIGNRRNGAEVHNFVEPATGVVAVFAV